MSFYQWCEVWRKGFTSTKITQEWGSNVYVAKGGPTVGRQSERGIVISTDLPSKGGGTTELRIFVDPGGFADLAKAMADADFGAAADAFGKALVSNHPAFVTQSRKAK